MTTTAATRSDDALGLPSLVGWLLGLWLVANVGPYLLVFLLTGQPFYQALPLAQGLPIEAGLQALNLLLPLWWLRWRGRSLQTGIAWRRPDWRSAWWALLGLAVTLLWGSVLTWLAPGTAPTSAGGEPYPPSTLLLVLHGLVGLWLVTVAGEEVMFRGWMQTQLARRGPGWFAFLLPWLLFGLRHVPLQVYEGWTGPAGLAANLLFLYGWAAVVGALRWRTGSIAAPLLLHGALWWLVIVGLPGTGLGAAVGGIAAATVVVTRWRVGPVGPGGQRA